MVDLIGMFFVGFFSAFFGYSLGSALMEKKTEKGIYG